MDISISTVGALRELLHAVDAYDAEVYTRELLTAAQHDLHDFLRVATDVPCPRSAILGVINPSACADNARHLIEELRAELDATQHGVSCLALTLFVRVSLDVPPCRAHTCHADRFRAVVRKLRGVAMVQAYEASSSSAFDMWNRLERALEAAA